MGAEKKVLVVVLALDAEPWRSIEEQGQRATWAGDGAQVPILWLHGLNGGPARAFIRSVSRGLEVLGARRAVRRFRHVTGSWAAGRGATVEGRAIRTRVPETYITTNAKTIAAFRHLLSAEEFDYVLRTNSSTYVNIDLLTKFIQDIPDVNYYGGTPWQAQGVEYATGTSILLSRDLVEYVATDRNWEFALIDDLALGKSMVRAGAKVDPFPRVDVYTSDDLSALRSEDLKSTFIVRCKGLEGKRHDIAAMRRVHELYGMTE